MSRGPGIVQLRIEQAFAATPDAIFTVAELATKAYPFANGIERKHRVAVVRAIKTMEARTGWTNDVHQVIDEQLFASRPAIIFNTRSKASVAAARTLYRRMRAVGWRTAFEEREMGYEV